ncbi:MAG: hypothetical protein F6K23_00675 [Okeania sp. SIO2C9]|uniref:hypothetical protein n=1 Tax=Okeania sp. SIO2C9 TaxID=2607791 RepID=UPI0013C0CBA6|nr:hypothetical protein [Okeania sp. SIO2C9]NEQ71723.1 hypothetical protein [Okeania sp. SIO2C9]
MSGIFDTFGFANCFSPDDLPVWGEYIWYSYEDLFLCNNVPDLELQIDRVEQIWTKASYSYIQEGMAYSIIKVYKLYKKLGFKDFKEYCLKRVKKTAWRVEHIIKAAQTAWNLMVAGFNELPSNVSQAYALYEPLVKKGCDYDVEDAWKNILCRSQEENMAITAGLIEATVSPEKKRKRSKIKLPEEVMALLRKKAEEKGQNPEDLAAEIISEYFAVEQDSEPDTETVAEPESIDDLKGCVSKTPEIKAWEIDLQNLVQEKYTNKSNFETTADSSVIPGGCQSDGDIFSGGQVRRPPT